MLKVGDKVKVIEDVYFGLPEGATGKVTWVEEGKDDGLFGVVPDKPVAPIVGRVHNDGKGYVFYAKELESV